MGKIQSPRYSYNMLKVLQNSHNTSFLLVLVKLYIPVYKRNGKICNSVQSFKRLLKNGFLYFYATFIVLVSHFFTRSKFSVQVLSQANLYTSGRNALSNPQSVEVGSPDPHHQHACRPTPPLHSSQLKPPLRLPPHPSSRRGPPRGVFHHSHGLGCELWAGRAASLAGPARREGVLLFQGPETQVGATALSILGPDNPNYLKKISLAGKNQPFS